MYKQTKNVVLNKVARIFKKSTQTSIAPVAGASKMLNSLGMEADQSYMYQEKTNAQSIHTPALSPDWKSKADTESISNNSSQILLDPEVVSQKSLLSIEAGYSLPNEIFGSRKSFGSIDQRVLGTEENMYTETAAESDMLDKAPTSKDTQGSHDNISLQSLPCQSTIFVDTLDSSARVSHQTFDERIALFRKLMSIEPCLPSTISQRNMLSYEDSLFSISNPPSYESGKKPTENPLFGSKSLVSVAKMSLKSVSGGITPIQQRVSIRDRIRSYNSVPNHTPVNAPRILNVKRIKVLNKVALWEAAAAKSEPPIPVLHILQAQVLFLAFIALGQFKSMIT
ncbi:hypothetical protein CLU79DRAFT_735827 [Phycomyces nitens]|nr:hypothetical protein CLU79DRAFT_735827 [Phycomyces nitens]